MFSKIQPFLKKNIYRQEVRPNIITACDCSDEWVHFKQTQLSLRQEKTISQYKLYKKKVLTLVGQVVLIKCFKWWRWDIGYLCSGVKIHQSWGQWWVPLREAGEVQPNNPIKVQNKFTRIWRRLKKCHEKLTLPALLIHWK